MVFVWYRLKYPWCFLYQKWLYRRAKLGPVIILTQSSNLQHIASNSLNWQPVGSNGWEGSCTVQFSQNAPVVAHITLPKSRMTFDALNAFVFCGQGSSCRKVCAHITVASHRQESADWWCKLAFTSFCAQKTVEYRQMCGHTRAHTRIWRYLAIVK